MLQFSINRSCLQFCSKVYIHCFLLRQKIYLFIKTKDIYIYTFYYYNVLILYHLLLFNLIHMLFLTAASYHVKVFFLFNPVHPGCLGSHFPFPSFLCCSYFGYLLLYHLPISTHQPMLGKHVYPKEFKCDSLCPPVLCLIRMAEMDEAWN
jgi:hypothetical protein